VKLLTRNADYALRAICYMYSRKERVLSVAELVGELKVPRPFLRKSLQLLNKHGLVISYKGKGGGFRLSDKAQDVSALDIIESLQGPFHLNECSFKRKACPNIPKCPLRKRIERIEKHVASELKAITIRSLSGKKA
jgi:Rrf2 family transcriptional regulator, iron-sulfur cluster assembly transcription factor